MKEKSLMLLSCLILATALAAVVPRLQVTYAAPTTLRILPSVTELGPTNAIGQNITIDCRIENITDLYGVDIQIGWSTEFIRYVSHTKMIPAASYPGGIMHSPTIPVKNDVDETASMLGAAPGTMYWLAEASMAPAYSFNGTGAAFRMKFTVIKHPIGMNSHIFINITSSTLANSAGNPITHTQVNADILMHARAQPAGPTIDISHETYEGQVPHSFNTTVSIANLDAYWDLGGFDIQLAYNPGVLKATALFIDPEGWFASFWPGGKYIIKNDIDSSPGKIWVAVIGLPSSNGTHTEPSGSATLFKATFEAYGSGAIAKVDDRFSLAAFPHPERPESPFNSSETSVAMPFTPNDGFADIVSVTETTHSGYNVVKKSSSATTETYYRIGVPMLLFNVTCAEGTSGYCNVTIPLAFMNSNAWVVLMDGGMITPSTSADGTNTYVYFTYPVGEHKITIIGQTTIPEYSLVIMLTLMSSTIAIAFARKLSPKAK
jgi:hypothetical protein